MSSAGTNNDAENPLSGELVEWADVIFAMERTHRNKLQNKYRSFLGTTRIVVLDIPDEYEFMDESLVLLLETKMRRWLP